MKIEIKPATIKNLEDIQTLNLMLFEKEFKEFDNTLDCKWPFSKEGENYFKNRITKKDGCTFVAYVDNKIVGYLAGGINEKVKGGYRILPLSAEAENMFIYSEYRNMGIGTKLFQTFIDWCKSKKVKKLRVIASAQNKKAVDFYRKIGFTDYDLILEYNI